MGTFWAHMRTALDNLEKNESENKGERKRKEQ